MVDFQGELDKLLALETEPPPQSELAEAVEADRKLLSSLNRKQAELAMQVEELYDVVRESDTRPLSQALEEERKRSARLLEAAVGLSDLLEDFLAYARRSGQPELARQGELLWKSGGSLLEAGGVARLGEPGQPLDPGIHTVQAVEESPLPREQVVQVLRSGYRYLGEVARRATVTVSSGTP